MDTNELYCSILALDSWRRSHGWKGIDPFGIREKLYEKYGPGKKAFQLQDLISRLEKQYGFDHPELFHDILDDAGYLDPKTFANFGTGYLNLHRLTGADDFLSIACECGDWLIEDSDKRDIAAWGHPFVWYTEANHYFHKKNNPNIYITGLIIHFLLDLHEATREKKYLSKAAEATDYLAACPYHSGPDNRICFWYIIDRKELPIHNGNLFLASVLIRSGKKPYIELAERAVNYALADQNDDGSWYYYGPPRSSKMMMIDNYHTGFILEALLRSNDTLRRKDIEETISKGVSFYQQMFSPRGEPFRFDSAPFPQDIHDAAQGIITFALLKELNKKHIDIAETIAKWATDEMQDPGGFFYYRKLSDDRIIKFPYIRWSQAPMFKALTALLDALSS